MMSEAELVKLTSSLSVRVDEGKGMGVADVSSQGEYIRSSAGIPGRRRVEDRPPLPSPHAGARARAPGRAGHVGYARRPSRRRVGGRLDPPWASRPAVARSAGPGDP